MRRDEAAMTELGTHTFVSPILNYAAKASSLTE